MEELVKYIEIDGPWLVAEAEWMESELGVSQDLLDSRWAERMLKLRHPAWSDSDASWLLQQIGWF